MDIEENSTLLQDLTKIRSAKGLPYRQETVVSVYGKIILNNDFSSSQLSKLDQCSYLEQYLLPNYKQSSCKELDMSVMVMINFKFNHGVYFWDHFRNNNLIKKFSQLFASVLAMDKDALAYTELSEFVHFMSLSFKHVEEDFLSEETTKLLQMSMIKLLSKDYLKSLFLHYPKFLALYKKMKATSLPKECNHFPALTQLFWKRLVNTSAALEKADQHQLLFFEKYVELLCDLLSQHSTRRTLKFYLEDTKFILKAKLSKLLSHEKGRKFGLMVNNLQHLISLEINEETGAAFPASSVTLLHYDKMNEFQNMLFRDYKEKLGATAIKNITSMDSRKNLLDILDYLSDEEVIQLCQKLNLSSPSEAEFNTLQTIFREEVSYIDFIIEIIIEHLLPHTDPAQIIEQTPIYPTQDVLWDPCLIPAEQQGFKQSLPVPKLNLQFISFKDYLARNYTLFQLESAFEIRKEIEDIIPRTNPSFNTETGKFQGFQGWSRMAAEIKDFTIYEVGQPKVGSLYPSKVLAELRYSVATMPTYLKKEWESLKAHDVLMLVSFKKDEQAMETESEVTQNFRSKYGVQYVRGCEVVAHLDERRRAFNLADTTKKVNPEGNSRYLQVLVDSIQYEKDLKLIGEKDTELYSGFNLVMRRKAKENNFKPVLSTIKDLFANEIVLPKWLEDTLMGYGDANDAFYRTILQDKTKKMGEAIESESFNYFDTFLNDSHFEEAFKKNTEIPQDEKKDMSKPMHLQTENTDRVRHLTGRVVLSPAIPEFGKVIRDLRYRQKRNMVKFTKSQVSAIHSAMHEGLTLIEGPPGTGKTDVAVQIVSLLFNNFQNERTVMITHSNHALNDLFEKIANLNISERYLLRLGMGQKELSTEQDFGRQGRIDHMLSRRLFLLRELKVLSESLQINMYEDFTCENAEIFFKYHIQSRWDEYQKKVLNRDVQNTSDNAKFIGNQFPYLEYLKRTSLISLDQGIDNPDGTYFEGRDCDNEKEQAQFYWEIILNIFKELKECRAFELLRNNKERSNYLASRQARVVAMTSTHAALRRADLLETDFEFENVVIEEAAQILEIETFIPFLLQKTTPDGKSRLKRIILIGDRNQLPPIIKNSTFQRYCNMEQSLYSRLLRLDVHSFKLHEQGRCREPILDLFRWKYPGLKSLEVVSPGPSESLYTYANPGFLHEYQFVNVPDYNGKGEFTPAPYFYQNLAEAEYVVATYMLMVLNGIPANKISILTTYNGQKFLIRDIFHKKCSWNPLFKKPQKITTVDKYQGQQNDYILLSLVRTENLGHFRDPRRICVAFSRARLGLYVFGRYDLFKECYELKNTLTKMSAKPQDLTLIPEETYPPSRKLGETPDKEVKTIKEFTEIYLIVQKKLQSLG